MLFSNAFLFVSLSLTQASLLRRQSSTACNNSPDLCDKSYASITHLGAHDSPFIRDQATAFSSSGNQQVNTTVQLDAGVRMVTAQVHIINSEWHVCHTSCNLFDAGSLSDWLSEIKSWMDRNPNDVVTVLLVNSDNATPIQLKAAFDNSTIAQYAYTPPSTTSATLTWPTLQQLIDNKSRLITFVADLDPASNTVAPYLLDEFTFVFENPFEVTAAANFSCVADRPASVLGMTTAAINSDRLPLMNHFLDVQGGFGIETPNFYAVNVTNAPSGGAGNLGAAASSCKSAYGKAPTFILVDFFDQGPAISTVDSLNGVTTPVGRVSPQAAVTAGTTSGADIAKPIVSSAFLLGLVGVCMVVFA